MTDRSATGTLGTWRIVAESVAVALVGYLVAGAAETALIRLYNPSERALAWVSDVVLSAALGIAVYLWRHLGATRQALMDHERAELVLDTQLRIAADLQRRLLPVIPSANGAVEWAAALKSAGKIGGDFYDLVALPGGQWMVLAADVSGKGIPAAMALPTLRGTFRSLTSSSGEPGEMLSRLSETLYEQWGGSPYLTAIVARVNVGAGTLRYASAAHPSGLLFGPQGLRMLDSLGPPAALFPGVCFEEREIAIEPGDVCVMVSDGVTEALGDDASAVLKRLVSERGPARARAQRVCDSVMAAAIGGAGPEGVADWDDDRTVVVLALPDDDATSDRPVSGSSTSTRA